MTRVIEARAIISAADKTGGTFAAIAEKIRRMQTAAKSANSAAASAARTASTVEKGSRMARSGGAAVAAVSGRTLGAVGAAYGATQAIKRNAEAELMVTRIGLTADAPQEAVDKLQTSLRNLAFESGTAFNQVAEGLSSLVAGGQDLPDAMKAMPAIAMTAQAAGAEMKDMASTSLALNQALGITSDKMQNAFDVMVTGGKEGKFELKDMAQYFASLAPQAATLGLKGEAGLREMVSLLQTIRAGTGTSEEAKTGFQDLMSKMETDETFNKFKKFGVDIRKEMAKARKEGTSVFDTFIEATKKASKGDLSKLPQLFGEKDSRQAMLALIQYSDMLDKVRKKTKEAQGSGRKDFMVIDQTQQVALNRLAESLDRVQAAGGAFLGKYAAGDINAISSSIEKAFSDGLYSGVSDFIAKLQPGGEGDLVGQFTTAVLKAMGIKPAAPMFTPEKTTKARDEQEARREPILRGRIDEEEAKERNRKAGPGETLAPLHDRIRSNPVIADARESLFTLEKHAPVPFNKQAPGQVAGFGKKTAEDYFASLPKAPQGWSQAARDMANKPAGTIPESTPLDFAELSKGLKGLEGEIAKLNATAASKPDAKPIGGDDAREGGGADLRSLGEQIAGALAKLDGAQKSDGPVTAELHGTAQVEGQTKVEVTVTASSQLLQVIDGVKHSVANLKGQLRTNGPGSTGVSSPDARATDVWRGP